MWLKYIKPTILSLIIYGLLEGAILAINKTAPYNYSFYIGLAFLVVVLGILWTYQSCAQDRLCRAHTRLIVFAIPPLFLFWGLAGFLYYNTNFYLQQIFLALSLGAFFVIFSEIFSDLTHQLHDTVKFLTIFLLYDSILETVRYFYLSRSLVLVFVFLVSMLCFHHLFWRLNALKIFYSTIGLIISLAIGLFALGAAFIWPLASYFLLAVMTTSLYYVAWGILHHHIDCCLTKKVVLDYLMIGLFVFLTTLGLVFITF